MTNRTHRIAFADFLPGALTIGLAAPRDYAALERFHYVPGRPRTWAAVWAVRYREAQNEPRADALAPPRIIAIAVLSYPTVACAARDAALDLSRLDPRARLAWVNRNVRTISRVIVHPQFRGVGVAARLVRHACDHCPTPWVEALAAMGKVNPFFERAGMRRVCETAAGVVYYLREKPDAPRRRQNELTAAGAVRCQSPGLHAGDILTKGGRAGSNGSDDRRARVSGQFTSPTGKKGSAMSDDINVHERLSDPEALRAWVAQHLNLRFPKTGVCPGHQSPFDYLAHAYFEPARDVVVWAPRGGGKTRLGAAATLLDLLHKPGVAVRILGGSLDQSLRMWEHLLPDVTAFAGDQLAGRLGARFVRFDTGGSCGVITQSQRAVRGLRIQKLRCDEVEEFDPRVWEAAQLVTRTLRAEGGEAITGVVEAFSTFHRPGGLMERVVENAAARGTRVIRWCLLEVLERCPAWRECATCPLLADCGGRAKTDCDGFFPIDDAIQMKARVSRETWEAEMMCRRPSRTGCVFGTFDVAVHVRERLPAPPPTAAEVAEPGLDLGVDFGFRNPFVCLWVRRDRFGRSMVIDEYVKAETEVDAHVREIKSRYEHGPVRRVGCDPAGSARNEQTGVSNVQKLRAAGFRVGFKRSLIQEGLELIRLGLQSGAGGDPTLYVHPRCKQLIAAMRAYHYGDKDRAEVPKKDGPDHLIDALRYCLLNRDSGEAEGRDY